jgi:hypothetical protein
MDKTQIVDGMLVEIVEPVHTHDLFSPDSWDHYRTIWGDKWDEVKYPVGLRGKLYGNGSDRPEFFPEENPGIRFCHQFFYIYLRHVEPVIEVNGIAVLLDDDLEVRVVDEESADAVVALWERMRDLRELLEAVAPEVTVTSEEQE